MFIELYATKFAYGRSFADQVSADGVRPLDMVVNADAISAMDMHKTDIGGISYHKVRLSSTAAAALPPDLPDAHLYITDAAYERLIH